VSAPRQRVPPAKRESAGAQRGAAFLSLSCGLRVFGHFRPGAAGVVGDFALDSGGVFDFGGAEFRFLGRIRGRGPKGVSKSERLDFFHLSDPRASIEGKFALLK